MKWREIENALKLWFSRVTGIDPKQVIWEGEAVPFPARPYGELHISAIRNVGTDERREGYDSDQPAGKEIVRSIYGQRLFTLGCKVRSRDNRPGNKATAFLEKARTSLAKLWVLDLFSGADISFVEALPTADLPGTFDDREESFSSMDVTFCALVYETDPGDRGTYINTVEITSNVVDTSGDAISATLQLDEEEMP